MVTPRNWSYSFASGAGGGGGRFAPASGSLAISAAVAEFIASLSVSGPVVPTTATLSGSDTAGTGVAHTSRVTLNQPADQAYTVTWSRSNGGTGPATSVIAQGQTYVDATSTWASAGSGRTVSFSIAPALTVQGSPLVVNVQDFAWTLADGGTFNVARNSSVPLATGVPAGVSVYFSPDPLPGVSLALNSGTLSAVGDATVPSVDNSAPGSAKDAISARDFYVSLHTDPPVATVVNVTKGITYDPSTNYAGRTGSHAAGRWNAVVNEASPGDIIEVSPGALMVPGNEGSIYYSTSLDSTVVALWKPLTVRGMSGQGRWRAGYPTRTFTNDDRNGITIYAPQEIGVRGSFVVSDFELDDWGRFASSFGFRVRSNATQVNDWVDYHTAVTVRNFKIGKPPYERSASGFAGNAQTWTIEDGHIYDTGGAALISPGYDHNFYIGGQYLVMRGVRSARTRGHSADGLTLMDGHHAKLTFNYATIESSVFDCGPKGDSSIQIQMKGGGNLVVRGCLLIAGRNSQTATGNIVFEKEGADSPPGNYGGWTYGLAGHSVLVERNVFVNHRAYIPGSDQRAFVYFRPNGHPWQVLGVSSAMVRDNIGISTVPSSLWIANCPDAGQGAWIVRNTARAYNSGEWAFADRELLLYADALGAPSAWGGSASVPQFLWPHGYRDVTRATQGLG